MTTTPPVEGTKAIALKALSCCRTALVVLIVAGLLSGATRPLVPNAVAAPDPQLEYLYDVSVRRQYHFPTNDPIGYGHAICDKVTQGESYAQVMGDVKSEVTPNDELASGYLVTNAVNWLCPGQIWQLRNSAAGYIPPP